MRCKYHMRISLLFTRPWAVQGIFAINLNNSYSQGRPLGVVGWWSINVKQIMFSLEPTRFASLNFQQGLERRFASEPQKSVRLQVECPLPITPRFLLKALLARKKSTSDSTLDLSEVHFQQHCRLAEVCCWRYLEGCRRPLPAIDLLKTHIR